MKHSINWWQKYVGAIVDNWRDKGGHGDWYLPDHVKAPEITVKMNIKGY